MNYILEGNFNFNTELLKMICEDDSPAIDTIECCLISGEPLLSSHITLKCRHKFNYLNIVEEVKRQRIPSYLEVQRINTRQIKCPYCRTIQDGILPFKEELSEKIYGVNWPPSKMYQAHRCKAIFRWGKKKGGVCSKPCVNEYCNRHKNYAINKKIYLPSVSQIILGKNIKLCQTILRYGKRKGGKCLCKCKSSNQSCMRHLPKTKKDNK